jgi:hypothetical protein
MAHEPRDFKAVKGTTKVPRPNAKSKKTAFVVTKTARESANPGE